MIPSPASIVHLHPRSESHLNPASGNPRTPPTDTTEEALQAILTRATKIAPTWSATPLATRLERVEHLCAVLDFRTESLVEEITRVIGKPLHESRREVEKCIRLARYYLSHATPALTPERRPGSLGARWIVPTPLGLVLTISPSNFPLWQAVRSSLPAIIAGNVVLNKPSPHAASLSEALVEMFHAAGFPAGVFQCAHLSPEATDSLIGEEAVRAVAFTGGRLAGRQVAAAAGRNLKPVVLELGGNDAALVLDDADVDLALRQCVQARLYNNGQTCLGPKRILVTRRHYYAACEKARLLASAHPHGNPTDPDTARGPLISFEARRRLHKQVRTAQSEGAVLLQGGRVTDGPGAFYPATVLVDVPIDSIVFREEIFGPVISITAVEDEAGAIAAANAGPFGLAASVFTASESTARRVMGRLEVANVGWNMVARSGPEYPFGGIRESGFGRELAEAGLLNFTYPKVHAGLSEESVLPPA